MGDETFFETEMPIIQKAESILEERPLTIDPLLEEFQSLLNVYIK